MASKYSKRFTVPEGFTDILHNITREVLRDQPDDVVEYAALYFEALRDNKPFRYESKYNLESEDINKEHFAPHERQEFAQESTEKYEEGEAEEGDAEGEGEGEDDEIENNDNTENVQGEIDGNYESTDNIENTDNVNMEGDEGEISAEPSGERGI